MSVDDRLIDLETRLAHFERLVEELSDVLAEQGRLIEMQAAQIRHLRDRVLDLATGAERSPQDDKPPPHY